MDAGEWLHFHTPAQLLVIVLQTLTPGAMICTIGNFAQQLCGGVSSVYIDPADGEAVGALSVKSGLYTKCSLVPSLPGSRNHVFVVATEWIGKIGYWFV